MDRMPKIMEGFSKRFPISQFLFLYNRHLAQELSRTTMEGNRFDLNPIALHP